MRNPSLSSPPDFFAKALRDQAALGLEGAFSVLDEGRRWRLGPTLSCGGSILFPHASISTCGHQIAAAVHACLDCGADRILALGVLHALTSALREARDRVAAGGDPANESSWGIQGPGCGGSRDWEREFSLSHFLFLLDVEVQRRGIPAPVVNCRYPFLAAGHPERLPGIGELERIAADAVVVGTGDLVHHGIGYGDPPSASLDPDHGGLIMARRSIQEGLRILGGGTPTDYEAHSARSRSDARDVGQVLLHLRGPMSGRILDLVADDMSTMYGGESPTWVACTLVELTPVTRGVSGMQCVSCFTGREEQGCEPC